MSMNTATLTDNARVDIADFEENDDAKCPCHGGKLRKIYRYGSTMTAETDLFTFYGCGCSVAIRHDPVGTYPSVATYHDHFASGVGRFHAMRAADKYA